MGDVYRAYDTRLHRSVALKILRLDWVDEATERSRADVIERMFREARAAAALEHPNVVVIHDVGEVTLEGADVPSYFIAMEYIDGKVLRSFVGASETPIAERVRWLIDAARALGFAHERGIIHRDVKPENIILRGDGVVKVLDFGIARRSRTENPIGGVQLPTLTEKGAALGTPRYMAPEQMLNDELDGRADQYAWGLTAYELLAGQPPWSGATDSLQLVAQVLTRAPEPLRSRTDQVPEEIANVIDRALARERSDRFPSMAAVVEALELARGPVSSRKEGLELARGAGAVSSRKEAVEPVRAPLSPRKDLPTPAPPQASPAENPTVRFPGARLPRLQEHPEQEIEVTERSLDSRPPPRRRWRLVAALAALGVGLGVAAIAMRGGSSVLPPLATAPPAADPNACSSSAQCSERLHAPAICRSASGACVALDSDDCHIAAEPSDLASDSTVWIGSLLPLTGPDAKAFGTRESQAIELARRDFAHMLAGATAGPHGGHPLALVACDDAVNPSRALHHLVDDVGVPAVIGFRTSDEAIESATSTLIPKGVLGIAALNTSPIISSLPQVSGQPRMIWRTTYSAAEMALPIAQIVPQLLEPELAPKLGGQPLRVALVRQDDATGLGFADTLFKSLRFNDRSALENESSYREFVSALGAGGSPSEHKKLLDNLIAFAPHVIVYFGSSEALADIAEPLERGWRDPGVRPRYVKTSPFGPPVHAFIGTNAERRRRFLSLTTVSTTAANARFVARYNETFADTVTRTFSPNSSYDAFYVIAYATYALGGAPVTGAALANALPRLTPPGTAIDVGPSGIFDAINKLSGGGRVDLNGATGPLDFDPATGDALVDLAVLCVDVDGRGSAAGNRESGLVYDATSRALRGTMRCP
jgi:serine/threonine protein kinase/ABC-type branched-subunit amino acid transport system substrate-binding protein